MPPGKRPREKLMKNGPDSLSNSELLSKIFITGSRSEGVLDLSNRVIKEYGSRSITLIKDVEKVMDLLGVGFSKACQLVSVFELGRRFFKEESSRMPTIRGPEDVYLLSRNIRFSRKEELRVYYLNSRQRVIYEEIAAIGTLNINIAVPRDILQPAVELMSTAFILVHNHPSGIETPSEEDIRFTKKLVEASKLLGIELLDHLIVSRKGYTSLKNIGII